MNPYCSSFRRRKKLQDPRPESRPGQEKVNMDLDSSSSDSDSSESESISTSQSTIWIGNEDGEIYIFNYLDNIRLKPREKMVRLSLPIMDIVYVEENVFVSMSSKTHNQLLCFHRARGKIIFISAFSDSIFQKIVYFLRNCLFFSKNQLFFQRIAYLFIKLPIFSGN